MLARWIASAATSARLFTDVRKDHTFRSAPVSFVWMTPIQVRVGKTNVSNENVYASGSSLLARGLPLLLLLFQAAMCWCSQSLIAVAIRMGSVHPLE